MFGFSILPCWWLFSGVQVNLWWWEGHPVSLITYQTKQGKENHVQKCHLGITIRHYKDPYQATSTMESKKVFSWLMSRLKCLIFQARDESDIFEWLQTSIYYRCIETWFHTSFISLFDVYWPEFRISHFCLFQLLSLFAFYRYFANRICQHDGSHGLTVTLNRDAERKKTKKTPTKTCGFQGIAKKDRNHKWSFLGPEILNTKFSSTSRSRC